MACSKKELLIAIFFCASFSSSPCRAAISGKVTVDASSFAKSSETRSTSSTFIHGAFHAEREFKITRFESDVEAYALLNDAGSSFTPDVPHFYIGTNKKYSQLHEVSFARQLVPWSVADDYWKGGMWNSRFSWDPINMKQVGLIGGFYRYRSKKWRVNFFASPIHIPERGVPQVVQDGRIDSASPWFTSPVQTFPLLNQSIPIRYSLNMPGIGELIFRPGAALNARYGEKTGFWVSGSYGFLPVNQSDLATDVQLDPASGEANAEIHPVFHYHHVATVEAGVHHGPGSGWWVSATGEVPVQADLQPGWQINPIGPAVQLATGLELNWMKIFDLSVSYIWVRERRAELGPEDINVPFPSRFLFRRAMRFGGVWRFNRVVNYQVSWTHDVISASDLVSFGISYKSPRRPWQLGIGADFIAAKSDDGYIGQLRGNDRVRGTISYVF